MTMDESTLVPQGKESLITPGANPRTWFWLLLIGIPAILLFLIYEKQQGYQLMNDQAPAHHVSMRVPVYVR